ncbi:hypothetical protein RUM44_002618 [Polyplax serrata]|uniref:Potassium voltage-gated channel subfamily KQT member 1 n=1 Tax=Polyplax serrata TaxID=468196 RepID=A0ABR1AF94_POLSC
MQLHHVHLMELVQVRTLEEGLDPKGLLQDRSEGWEKRYLMKEHRRAGATFQGKVYNFLERPSGWKCVLYHIAV